MNSFEKFLIAHLIADFLLQNNWMALNKTKKLMPLIVHGVIYAICMFVTFPEIVMWRILRISVLHCIVDRYSLADKWLRLIKGRSFISVDEKYFPLTQKDYPIYVSFTCIVYVVVDFLIHFLITYPLIRSA